MSDENKLLKTAADKLRTLAQETKTYRNKEEIEKLAFSIVTKMAEQNSFDSPKEALEKYSEYKEKDIEDLKITEKALELDLKNFFNNQEKVAEDLGSLTNEPTGHDMDNLTSMLLEDL
jgi:hypothetical protein